MAMKMEFYITIILTILVIAAGILVYEKGVSSSEKSIIKAYYLSQLRNGNDKIEVETLRAVKQEL
jgi:hypothetical protein